jgi:hypothetical protein
MSDNRPLGATTLGSPSRGPAGRCVACGRPIASALPRCLYCGATLPENAPPPAELPDSGADRVVLVVDTTAGERVLVEALGLSLAEAALRSRRGRHQLHRILSANEAESEARRLAERGVIVILLAEAEVRQASHPRTARGGDLETGTFWLASRAQTVRLDAAEVLTIVWGPIRRELARRDPGPLRTQRLAPGGRLQEGEVFHVHVRSDPRPLEIEPSSFEFSEARGGLESSRLRIQRALEALVPGVPIDRSFGTEVPALGVSQESAPEPSSTLDGLRAKTDPHSSQRPTVVALDNLAQFRFHSAWRGLLARRLAG